MKFHFWYTTLSLFFMALGVATYSWLLANERLISWVPLTDFFLMVLATARLVRLFTYDIITAFIRDWFAGKELDSLLGTLGALLNCPWCSGLWFALFVAFFYFATPIAWYVIFVLALSYVATALQLLMNFIGWSAEAKKRQVQS